MTETTNHKPVDAMLLPELKQLASSMGIKGASGMRKGDLIAAIKGQSASQPPIVAESAPQPMRRRAQRPAGEPAGNPQPEAPATAETHDGLTAPQPTPQASGEHPEAAPERPERRRRDRAPRLVAVVEERSYQR